jgi:hypothetical protein
MRSRASSTLAANPLTQYFDDLSPQEIVSVVKDAVRLLAAEAATTRVPANLKPRPKP